MCQPVMSDLVNDVASRDLWKLDIGDDDEYLPVCDTAKCQQDLTTDQSWSVWPGASSLQPLWRPLIGSVEQLVVVGLEFIVALHVDDD